MVYSPVRLNIGIWIREYIQEVGHMNEFKFLKISNSYPEQIENLCENLKWISISTIYVNCLILSMKLKLNGTSDLSDS